MGIGRVRRRVSPFSLLALGAIVLAGCQSDNAADALDLAPPPSTTDVRVSDLRAYCPPVQLREGTAYFGNYERGGKDDASRLIYQASIADVTRSCTHANGITTVNVAVAGRVVPGPKGKAGSLTMPIRVVMLKDGQVAYSQLHQHSVQVGDTIGATQFVFTDSGASFPTAGPQSIIIYAGYDEGPPPRNR